MSSECAIIRLFKARAKGEQFRLPPTPAPHLNASASLAAPALSVDTR